MCGIKNLIAKFIDWFCPKGKSYKEEFESCTSENKLLSDLNDSIQEQNYILIEELAKVNKLLPKETDYSIIPEDWEVIIPKELLVTNKYVYYGTNIKQDLTDLVDSSYTSRKIAKNIVNQKNIDKDTSVYQCVLKVYNYLITWIKYEKNQVQYGKLDQWDNGDLALVTKKGDCDLSSRAFIRVLKDVINLVGLDFETKHIFLCIGYYGSGESKFGHAWVQVYLNSKWYLLELTREYTVSRLSTSNTKYDLYFCHNSRIGWKQNDSWQVFL